MECSKTLFTDGIQFTPCTQSNNVNVLNSLHGEIVGNVLSDEFQEKVTFCDNEHLMLLLSGSNFTHRPDWIECVPTAVMSTN